MIPRSSQSRGAEQRQLRVHLVPWMVAGIQTQFVHLRNELAQAGVDFSVSEVHPWVAGGRIETMPLPSKMRGTIRSLVTLRQAFKVPADAVWSQVALPVLPYLLATGWLRRAPIFYANDCTPKLLFELGPHYHLVAGDPGSAKGRLTTAGFKNFFSRCAGLLPWSDWAARSMIADYGADPTRVRVLHPGIDTGRWKPVEKLVEGNGRPQLLFVGADFERKGGTLLLDLYRRNLRDECDLHLVTKARLPSEPGVTVHNDFGPDDASLLQLFQTSHIVVVPTLADCFSMAAIEAMACGLPVITSPVGGIPEIVMDGETGYLVPPGDARRLLESIRTLVSDSQLRHRLGRAGRAVAERRFDASTQSRVMVGVMINEIEWRARSLVPSR